jgi:hypothetical protein
VIVGVGVIGVAVGPRVSVGVGVISVAFGHFVRVGVVVEVGTGVFT